MACCSRCSFTAGWSTIDRESAPPKSNQDLFMRNLRVLSLNAKSCCAAVLAMDAPRPPALDARVGRMPLAASRCPHAASSEKHGRGACDGCMCAVLY